jgi:chemotaxis protein MotB
MSEDPQECPQCEAGAPRWMTTFGDLMSLLLCFFVLLLSFSQMDNQKYKQVAGSMKKAFGVQRIRSDATSAPLHGLKIIAKDFDQDAIATRMKKYIGRELQADFGDLYSKYKKDIEIKAGKNNVTIRLMGESTFDSGKAVIKPELKPMILRIGQILAKTTHDGIIIAGHTDNVPVKGGIYKTNLQLSIARAASVAQFLLDHTAIDPRRVSTMGFGQYRPIASNRTAAGRRKNRRVDIIVGTIPLPQRRNY